MESWPQSRGLTYYYIIMPFGAFEISLYIRLYEVYRGYILFALTNIVGYTVWMATRERRVRSDFRKYIRWYTSPNRNFEYGYPHSNALLQFCLKAERCKPHKAARYLTKGDLINDSNYFWQYIAGYTVANFWRYPIKRRVTKASALEFVGFVT